MKKYLVIALLMWLGNWSFAQNPYKYVIIPTGFSEIGTGFNPYGVCSTLQQIFNSKSIQSVFESADRPADYCDALHVELVKTSTMLQNRLVVNLKDCQGQTIWSREGRGRSKDFLPGYAEALENALSELEVLPENDAIRQQSVAAARQVPVANEAYQHTQPVPAVGASTDDQLYRPQNLYYNYSYFVDVVSLDQGRKQLLLLNGELLGYENMQQLGILIPSGLDDVFNLQWVQADGTILTGVANLTANKLKISVPVGEEMKIISLQKY